MKNSDSRFTSLHRFLHWTTALAMMVLFITGFLRMYWMNRKHITSLIENYAPSIPKDQMNEIAKSIREPMWVWHEIFAYVIFGVFIIRIIYMILKGIRFPNPLNKKLAIKERFQGWMYIYFYVYVLIASITGLCLQYKLFSDLKDPIETVHKWGLYLFPAFLVFHAIGIYISEKFERKGITSKMIGGNDK